jgi:hypothetical protein
MDGIAIVIMIVGFGGYILSHKKPFWLLLGGIGIGLFIGAISAYLLVMSA